MIMADQQTEPGMPARLTQPQRDALDAYLRPSARSYAGLFPLLLAVSLFVAAYVACDVYAGPPAFAPWSYVVVGLLSAFIVAISVLDMARDSQHRRQMRRRLPEWGPHAVALYYRELVHRGELREG